MADGGGTKTFDKHRNKQLRRFGSLVFFLYTHTPIHGQWVKFKNKCTFIFFFLDVGAAVEKTWRKATFNRIYARTTSDTASAYKISNNKNKT